MSCNEKKVLLEIFRQHGGQMRMSEALAHGISRTMLYVLRDSQPPALDFPPVSVHKISATAFHVGIEGHQFDRVSVRIYSPEKNLADCFKSRNKLGTDVVLEALKLYIAKEVQSGRGAQICQNLSSG